MDEHVKDLFMGCDPGMSGCFSVIDREGDWVQDIRMDGTLLDIARGVRLIRREICFALIEKVHSMPKQGVASSFKFGDAFGMMRGMIAVCNIRHEYISPMKWQKQMGCLTKGDKNVSKAAAQQLFPKVKVIHKNADALLLAELARRMAIQIGW